MRRVRWMSLAILALLGGAPLVGAADPLALDDPRPRWVEVRFESSPAAEPGRLRSVFGPRLPAWLEPGLLPGQVRVAVPAREVEERLLSSERVVPGSFGDFVWVFDAASGHVLGASLAGRVVRTLDWGLVRTDAEVEIRFELGTLQQAGYAAPTSRLGQTVFAVCTPGEAGCTAVAPVPLDPRTGYVNAVGPVFARALRVGAESFSPLGEAVFSELPGAGAVALASDPGTAPVAASGAGPAAGLVEAAN